MYLNLLKDILSNERAKPISVEILDRVRDGIAFLENGDYRIVPKEATVVPKEATTDSMNVRLKGK